MRKTLVMPLIIQIDITILKCNTAEKKKVIPSARTLA